MSKHTPGPWTVNPASPRDHHRDSRLVDDAGDCIAIVRGESVADSIHIANARLIAAAPDLLAGCRRALAEIDPEPDGQRVSARCRCCGNHPTKHAPSCLVLELRAAIAKAEGGAA